MAAPTLHALQRCPSCLRIIKQSCRLVIRDRPGVTPIYVFRSQPVRQASGSSRGNQSKGFSGLINKWTSIPVGVGFAYIGYQQYGHVIEREEKKLGITKDPESQVARPWQVSLYKALPLKIMSRLWGKVNNLTLPTWMREPLYKMYIWAFGCNMEEAAVRDLTHYSNLGQFFRRQLRPGVRPVDHQCCVTCPSDGRVLIYGEAENGLLEQVKGVRYCLQDFLGPQDWLQNGYPVQSDKPQDRNTEVVTDRNYQWRLKRKDDTKLYHCVIYLAPGDYHGFHSPTEWTIDFRRHFPGELLSVSPGIARLVKGLFSLNERAVYIGTWSQGFFALAAVGATNVGSIKVYHDKPLLTNVPVRYMEGAHFDYVFHHSEDEQGGLAMRRGERFGEFNLGSTIVLVFEAPRTFKFSVEAGQRVKYGEPLGSIEDKEC